MTTKQKIDQALGIQSDQSIDEFLDTMQIHEQHDVDQLSAAVNNIDKNVKDQLVKIDAALSVTKTDTMDAYAMQNVQASFDGVKDLIDYAKKIFLHVYSGIIGTDLIDPELVESLSKLLESLHLSIKEFIDLYRDRQHYFDKVKLMYLDQQNKKELLEIKFKHACDVANKKNADSALSVDNVISFSQEEIIKMLDKRQY